MSSMRLRRMKMRNEKNQAPAALEHLGGSWYQLSDGRKVQGKAKAEAAQEAINNG